MRSSLIVLAIVLAMLRLVRMAAARRVRGAVLVPARPRVRLAAAGAGERAASRFTAWRYYGFSSHAPEAEGSSAGTTQVVASSPAVGSVVSILPDDCVTTVVNGHVYCRCGSVWYQRQNTGSDVTYVVVPAP